MVIYIDWDSRRVFTDVELDDVMYESDEAPMDFEEWLSDNYSASEIYELAQENSFTDFEATLRGNYEDYRKECIDRFMWGIGKYEIHPKDGITEIL